MRASSISFRHGKRARSVDRRHEDPAQARERDSRLQTRRADQHGIALDDWPVGPRNQTRRLADHCPQGWRAGEALQPSRQRPDRSLPPRGAGPSAVTIRHHRRRGEVFRHACKLGLEGIVSKRKGALPVRPLAGLAQDKEPRWPTAKREAEGDSDDSGPSACRSSWITPPLAVWASSN
jgi:hypothetical protein